MEIKKEVEKKRKGDIRCPRCEGYLYPAEYRYTPSWVYKDILHCFGCARNWRILPGGCLIQYGNGKGGV